MTEPCTSNSNTWELSGPNCRTCGHHGFMHPGGGGSELTHCLICSVTELETALLTREHELSMELDRVHALITYIGDRHARDRGVIIP